MGRQAQCRSPSRCQGIQVSRKHPKCGLEGNREKQFLSGNFGPRPLRQDKLQWTSSTVSLTSSRAKIFEVTLSNLTRKIRNRTMIQRKLGVVLLLICCLSVSAASQARGAEPASVHEALDYSVIKKDLAVFQGVVDTTVRQNFQGPFPILGSTTGTYLLEYGAVFNLEVNLYQIRVISPFDLMPHTEKELNDAYNSMMKRIETLKGNLIKVMGEHGPSLEQFKPDDN